MNSSSKCRQYGTRAGAEHCVDALERRLMLAAAELDRTFDGNGLAATDFPATQNAAEAVISLPAGKSLVGTAAGIGYRIARFNADGSLDRTFGGDGRVSGYGRTGLTVAPDGKVLVAGPGLGVTRYNADGTLDTTFGRGGADGDGVATARADPLSQGGALVVLPDGNILVAGTWTLGELAPGDFIADLALVRYRPDGTLDTTFGSNGVRLAGLEWGYASAAALTVLPSSRLLAYAWIDDQHHGVVRFNPDLTLDSAFGGGDGAASEAWDASFSATAILVGGAHLYVAGTASVAPGASTIFSVTRLNADGVLDQGYGGGTGHFAFPSGDGGDGTPAVGLAPDGSVLVAGPGTTVARYTAAGTIDPTFGPGKADGDGRVTVDFRGGGDAIAAVAATTAGDVFLAGSMLNAGGGADLVVGHLRADGSRDTSFSGGETATRFAATAAAAAVAIQPDGKAVVAGGADHDFALVRYNPDGSLDTSFGPGGFDGGGRVLQRAESGAFAVDGLSGLAVLPGGKLLAVGTAGREMLALRYNPDGSLDSTFGTYATGTVSIESEAVAHALVRLPNGRFLVAGTYYTYRGHSPRALLARLNADGTRDTTFGDGGDVVPTGYFADEGYVEHAIAVAAADDGRIIVAGPANGGAGFCVIRLSADGAPDASFGNGGLAVVDFDPASADERPKAVAVSPGGALVVAGRAGGNVVLAQLTPSGTLDHTFNAGRGYVLSPGDSINALLPWAGGKLIVGGSSAAGDFLLARFNADGTPDGSFGPAGYRAMANFSGRDSDAALAVAPNGRIVAVGSTELPGEGSKFAIARFRGAAGESASTARTYQAEAAILSGPVVSRANGGYTGAGYADYLHASHDYVEWKVNLPSAALYELTLRYANGGNHDRPLDLSVNGQVVTPRLSFAPTWGWSVWKDVSATASLSAGVNTIRLTATGLSGPNVDALTIRAAPRQ